MKTNRHLLRSTLGRMLVLATMLTIWSLTDATAQQWQWPEKAENVKVLPETVTSRQLRATMFGFVRALNVRCEYCHDDSKGNRLSEIDFAADTKEAKETTRLMMRMVQQINGTHLADLGDDRMAVNCMTCHREQARPLMLEAVLNEVLEFEGIDAMVARYHELKEEHYGGFTYNFSENTLNRFGYRYLGQQRVDEAIAIFKLNAEAYPESFNVYDSLAEAYMAKGEPERAIAYFQRSLILNPDNQNAVDMIKKIQGGE